MTLEIGSNTEETLRHYREHFFGYSRDEVLEEIGKELTLKIIDTFEYLFPPNIPYRNVYSLGRVNDSENPTLALEVYLQKYLGSNHVELKEQAPGLVAVLVRELRDLFLISGHEENFDPRMEEYGTNVDKEVIREARIERDLKKKKASQNPSKQRQKKGPYDGLNSVEVMKTLPLNISRKELKKSHRAAYNRLKKIGLLDDHFPVLEPKNKSTPKKQPEMPKKASRGPYDGLNLVQIMQLFPLGTSQDDLRRDYTDAYKELKRIGILDLCFPPKKSEK